MSIRRFFKWQFPLRRRIRGVAFPFLLLLFLACGGEETITNPINGSTGSEQPEPPAVQLLSNDTRQPLGLP